MPGRARTDDQPIQAHIWVLSAKALPLSYWHISSLHNKSSFETINCERCSQFIVSKWIVKSRCYKKENNCTADAVVSSRLAFLRQRGFSGNPVPTLYHVIVISTRGFSLSTVKSSPSKPPMCFQPSFGMRPAICIPSRMNFLAKLILSGSFFLLGQYQ